ncbi:MAG: tetratricopeptide repeat protein [Alphaproteobacteria bacterium]
MTRVLVAFFVLLVVAAAPTAQARQGDPRLDGLFDKLLATTDSDVAQTIEASIWRIWIESGDAVLDKLMAHGILAMQAGAFDVALKSFDAIIEADPGFAEGWNKRATLYYLMEEYDASVRDVERTLALEPRHFGALSGMGLIYSAIDEDKAALEWFERALTVNPHMPFIRLRADMLRQKLHGEKI